MEKTNKKSKWIRYRFYTKSVGDYRPLVFNPKYPWWCTGFGGEGDDEFAVIVVYLPEEEDLLKYWDDAYMISSDEEVDITFTDRFQKPDWYIES